MGKYNDLDSKKWKEYNDIETDSLWIIEKRDSSGVHTGYYHGNFIPQIPRQLFKRYTKIGEWILDPFMGSGTSLIEAQRLGRNSIGIDLKRDVVEEAFKRIEKEKNNKCIVKVKIGDSQKIKNIGVEKVQFVIFHPPYWDIIKFSEYDNDLSNQKTLNEYLKAFSKVIDNTTKYLEKDRYCACIMGDKYQNGRVIPLGFECMNLFLKKGFILKGIVVKNFGETKGKQNVHDIWRYRALINDFYVFKHEYIFVFKKSF